MNTAEIKLELFRKIDQLNEPELKKLYSKFLAVLSSASTYNLTDSERAAVDEAIKASDNEQKYSHSEVIQEAKQRYPNLKFK
jgi:hypothetical protein